MTWRPLKTCLKCQALEGHASRGIGKEVGFKRGLCSACYQQVRLHGDLNDYPLVPRRNGDELVEDYLFAIETHGGSLSNIADRLGVTKDALYIALRRRGIAHNESA